MRKLIVNSSLFIVNCFILLSITSYLLPIVSAVESTSSSVLTKAKNLLDTPEFASKVAQLKAEINSKLQNKAYVGSVKQKSDEHSSTGSKIITLASSTGPKIVTVNQDTLFESKISKIRYSFKALAEEDYIAALGDVDETGTLIAKKIILLPDLVKDNKSITWGQVISISDNLVIKTKDSKNVTVTTTSSTQFKKGAQNLSFEDINLNDFIIVVGSLDNSSVLKVNFLYVIPQGGFIKPKKVATPSASPAAGKK